MSESEVRVRFPPSPTGYLHVGNVRSLLFNWLYAKKNQGSLILRIEDTDQQRSTPEFVQMAIGDVKDLGFDFQEGPECGGPHEPYFQSQRLEIYTKYAQQLLDEGRAYHCFCSPDLITEKRQAALKMGRPPHYDGTCRKLSLEEVKKKLDAGEKSGLRFKAYEEDFTLEDEVRGKILFKAGTVGDFLITRSPTDQEQGLGLQIGMPVYNFCCVIDDYLMKMTHIIRGEDHISNTSRQLQIYKGLGFEPPRFAHTAMVLGADKQKLSKRNGDVSARDYFQKGYLNEALMNFLALLGWWPSDDLKPQSGHPEIISREELIQHFSLKGLQKSPAVFDVQKLNWMNGFYIRMLPVEEIARRARPFFESSDIDVVREGLGKRSEEWYLKVVETVRGEVSLLSELPAAAKMFFEVAPEIEDKAKEVLSDERANPTVDAFQKAITAGSGEITPEEVDQIHDDIKANAGAKGKWLFMPIRAVVTGKTHGPELKQVLPLLGRENVTQRIESILSRVR